MIGVTASPEPRRRISSVERGSVLQLNSASSPTRTARRAHILWISLTDSLPVCELHWLATLADANYPKSDSRSTRGRQPARYVGNLA
jgi:hypothetical protein